MWGSNLCGAGLPYSGHRRACAGAGSHTEGRHILICMCCSTYISKRQAGIVLEPHRGSADAHARGGGDPHAGSAQRGNPGLGRAGIPPHGALRDRRHAAESPSCRSDRGTPVPRHRGAVRRLPHRGQAPRAPIRRHLQPAGLPLRDPRTVSPPQRRPRALRALGLQPRRPGRPAHRRHPVPDQATRQVCQRRRAAPQARPCRTRPLAAAAQRHGAAAAPTARRARRHRHAPGVPGYARNPRTRTTDQDRA